MENRNFKSYTVQDLVNKMKKLRQKYKQEKDKSSRSETVKRKNGSSLKLLTEHCVTFLLPSFFLISPRCRSFSLLNR